MQDHHAERAFLELLESDRPLWQVGAETIRVLPDWRSDDWALEGWFAYGPVCAAALHEAAHAAMALRFGARPLAVRLGPRPGLGSISWGARAETLRPQDQASVLLAGLAAELLAGADHPFGNARQDLMQAIRVCLGPPEVDTPTARARVDAALLWLWLDTLDAMAEPGMERAVRRLAGGLLRHRQPPGATWQAACRASCRFGRASGLHRRNAHARGPRPGPPRVPAAPVLRHSRPGRTACRAPRRVGARQTAGRSARRTGIRRRWPS
jgi:hypothetical protein